jgi:pentatricopeptide repeat protein
MDQSTRRVTRGFLTALSLAACAALTLDAAAAAEQSGQLQCAARDAKLIVVIEDVGEARSVPDEKVAEAWTTLLDARELCKAGRVEEALAVYDGILTPFQSAKR